MFKQTIILVPTVTYLDNKNLVGIIGDLMEDCIQVIRINGYVNFN